MLTAEQVIRALRVRYPKDQYALITEVGNSTGFKCRRHADVVVMGLWPSRGLEVIGIEVKVRRSDFLKELEQPEKADVIAQYCDKWFLAVGDSEIIKEGELPAMWGLLVPKDENTLRAAKDAPQMGEVKPLDRSFIAAMLRNAQCQLTGEAQLNREYERGRTDGIKAGQESAHWKEQRELDDLRKLKENVKAFHDTTGINIQYAHNIGKIGEAVRAVMNGQHTREMENLQGLKIQLSRIMQSIDNTLQQNVNIEPVKTNGNASI